MKLFQHKLADEQPFDFKIDLLCRKVGKNGGKVFFTTKKGFKMRFLDQFSTFSTDLSTKNQRFSPEKVKNTLDKTTQDMKFEFLRHFRKNVPF